MQAQPGAPASAMQDSVKRVVERLLVLNTTVRLSEFLSEHFDPIHVIATAIAFAYFTPGLAVMQKIFFLVAMNTALIFFDSGDDLAIINVIGFLCLSANVFRSHFDTPQGRRLILSLQYLLSDRVILIMRRFRLGETEQLSLATMFLLLPVNADEISPPMRWIWEGANLCSINLLAHIVFPDEDHSTGLEVRILASVLICSLASNLRRSASQIQYLYDFAILKTVAQVIMLFHDQYQLMLIAIVTVLCNELSTRFDDFTFMFSLLVANVVQTRVSNEIFSVASQDLLLLLSLSVYITHYVVDGVESGQGDRREAQAEAEAAKKS